MGYGYGGGGINTGLFLGAELAQSFLREQQRQAYLQQQLRTQQELGADQAQIAQLQQALAAQNAKVEALAAQNQAAAPAQAAPRAAQPLSPAEQQLMMQLAEQREEIEALKAAAK